VQLTAGSDELVGLNDMYREAEQLGLKLEGVAVDADGGFDEEWRSTGIEYSVTLDAQAGVEELARLVAVVAVRSVRTVGGPGGRLITAPEVTSAPGRRPQPGPEVPERLLAKRDAASEQLAALAGSFEILVNAAADVATDDEHDPEGATLAFERAQVAAIRDAVARHLAEVNQALADLSSGRYGICERSGLAIGSGRLAVGPAARRCLRYAASAR
jgi:DnaK suppressor protein